MGMLDEGTPPDGQNGQNPDQLKALYIQALMGQTDPRQLDPTMVGSFRDPGQQQIVSALMQANPQPPPMSDIQKAVLNKIASGEAPDYNTIYGGQKFEGYSDHPNVGVQIPGTNKMTHAAGLYQFEPDTWHYEQKHLGLPDFSPPSQDAAAWDLANTTYRQRTKHSLMGDASAGNVNWGALAGQWPSLKGSRPGPP